jgi:hypothetical protein
LRSYLCLCSLKDEKIVKIADKHGVEAGAVLISYQGE